MHSSSMLEISSMLTGFARCHVPVMLAVKSLPVAVDKEMAVDKETHCQSDSCGLTIIPARLSDCV